MKTIPAIGERVMRPYGRKDYAEYGEIGTVVEHSGNGRFKVELDDYQPFARSMYGSKAKPHGHQKILGPLNPSEVDPLHEVYMATAARLRRVANDFDLAAAEQAEKRLHLGTVVTPLQEGRKAADKALEWLRTHRHTHSARKLDVKALIAAVERLSGA